MFEIKLVHPRAAMDKSDPEGRYWESEVIRVHIARLHRWICDFSRLCESSPAAADWDTFLLDKLAGELATGPAGPQRPGSVTSPCGAFSHTCGRCLARTCNIRR